MPVTPTYPGVYIEEIPSGVRTIAGVSTSVTAFIGRARRGLTNEAVTVRSFGDFERAFGGLLTHSTMSYAVQHFFLNGGSEAIVVRVHNGATRQTLTLPGPAGPLTLEAVSEGAWGANVEAEVDHDAGDPNQPLDPDLFNLFVRERDPATGELVLTESFRNVSRDAAARRFVTSVLRFESALVRIPGAVPAARPDVGTSTPGVVGVDGFDITDANIADPSLEAARRGLWALERADIFNLLCIPPLTREIDVDPAATLAPALRYCRQRRAVLLVDAPAIWNSADDPTNPGIGVDSLGVAGPDAANAALYFPRLRMPDPLQENRLADFAPCGVVAGVIARTDAQRGVWKAPAGQDAATLGVRELTVRLTDGEQGALNPIAVNCLRTFPVIQHVVWGARTMRGADRLADEWKYLPVRRTALMIEEALFRGTQWVVFEPNDEPLWAQIRLNVGAYMHSLYRQGAFQGTTPRDAYLVKCDAETTTQNDIDRGIVNILVAFAPLKPAEFVIIKIQQKARPPQT
jgi:phage tail sheath protein FI